MDSTIFSNTISVEFLYNNYLKDYYIVNRKYQRKLVWTLQEKQAFIDSLYRNYAVPLLLFANGQDDSTGKVEILDGLQRMNAMCSFIEDEFPISIDGASPAFFDLQTLSSVKQLADQGKIKQKQPILSRDICSKIVQYPLSVSTINADEKSVETVFRRINSFGRQLSKQEIRQAGAIGMFPDIVRQIASNIRGDVSNSDILPLSKMKLISLSNTHLDYGIRMDDVFWVRQNIITIGNMRKSRDEELVATILTYMLLGKDIKPDCHTLNKLYLYEDDLSDGSNLYSRMEASIKKYGKDNVIRDFMEIHDIIASVAASTTHDFRSLIFGDQKAKGMFRSYQVIFLAIFELYINDYRQSIDINGLLDKLNGIGKNILSQVGTHEWDAKMRANCVMAVKGIIEPCFTKASGSDVMEENWVARLEDLIRKSIIEGTNYDFKCGFHDLVPSKDAEFNNKLIDKCIQILTSCANIGPKTIGYVIVGVADGDDAEKRFERVYETKGIKIVDTHFYVCGLNDEIKCYYGNSGDKFLRFIKNKIINQPIDVSAKQYILSHLKMVNYKGKSVLILSLQSDDKAFQYDNKLYLCQGNDAEEVTGAKEMAAVLKRFSGIV